MANQTITQLPAAGPITGTELVPIVQNGGTYHTTTAAIANSPTQTQTFLTVNNEPTLPNSRYFSTDANFTLSDGGSQSFFRLNLTGAAASLAGSGSGIQVKTSSTTLTGRTLASGTTGLSIANGDGISGNPTFSLTGNVLSLANAAGTGMLVLTGPSAITFRSITGTASEIDVTDGDGVFGNPTIGLADNPIVPGSEGMTLPAGNTAARPGSPSNGQVRYNTQTSRFEGYQGGSWADLGNGDGTVTSVDLSGGSTGLTVSGGPITSSGTLTLGGTPIKATNLDNGSANEIPYQSAPATTNYITAPVSADTYLRWNGSGFVWSALAGAGTVTSVSGSGGTTGLTLSGGPITSSGTLTIGGTLVVANGGTGATSLTGYLKGNGTSSFTGSSTIPNTDITGLGSMSTQSASSAVEWVWLRLERPGGCGYGHFCQWFRRDHGSDAVRRTDHFFRNSYHWRNLGGGQRRYWRHEPDGLPEGQRDKFLHGILDYSEYRHHGPGLDVYPKRQFRVYHGRGD